MGQGRQDSAIHFLQQEGSIIRFAWKRHAATDWVVIDPSFLINIMRCIITVKNTVIKDGILLTKDLPHVFYDLSSKKGKVLVHASINCIL